MVYFYAIGICFCCCDCFLCPVFLPGCLSIDGPANPCAPGRLNLVGEKRTANRVLSRSLPDLSPQRPVLPSNPTPLLPLFSHLAAENVILSLSPQTSNSSSILTAAGNPASYPREKRPATTARSPPGAIGYSINPNQASVPIIPIRQPLLSPLTSWLLNPMARFPFPSYLTHQLHLLELILPPHCRLASDMPPSPGSPTSVASTPVWALQLVPSHLSCL